MSLEKARAWMLSTGRKDITVGRSAREREFLDRICRIALDLDGVVLHQGAKAGGNGEQHALSFGRKRATRKTPVIFAGVLFRPADPSAWPRRSQCPAEDNVRLYVKISEAGALRSSWADMSSDDDGVKADAEWKYFEIPERVDISGDELLDLMEDSYFEVEGI